MKFIASDKDFLKLRNILVAKDKPDIICKLLENASASKYDYTGKEHGQYKGYFYFFESEEDIVREIYDCIVFDTEISNHFLVQIYRKLFKKQENKNNSNNSNESDIDFALPF